VQEGGKHRSSLPEFSVFDLRVDLLPDLPRVSALFVATDRIEFIISYHKDELFRQSLSTKHLSDEQQKQQFDRRQN